MHTISIRERAAGPGNQAQFEAEVMFDQGPPYPITVRDPFGPVQEQMLEWYFEQRISKPFTEEVRAQQAAASLQIYGERLFEQVFRQDPEIFAEYRSWRGVLDELQIEILGESTPFQALHWEALKDPDLPRPLAVDCVMVRKSSRRSPVVAEVDPSPVINLLVVVARPNEDRDVGYRTISRPLVELIQNSQLAVNVELLRPGTFEQLVKHLREEKPRGFYHVIHFDGHGAVLTYEQLQDGLENNNLLYQGRYGQEDLQPFTGSKAFLLMEGEERGQANPVGAEEVTALLTGQGIPICILNACQSGKQLRPEVDERETSLGSQLMAAGMQMVVAMGYSVSVTAAEILMQKLYEELFKNQPLGRAIQLGRNELFQRKSRRAAFDQLIDLEDWVLPVVYQSRVVDLRLQRFTPEQRRQYLLERSRRYRFQPPIYGFVGRDLDILKIEKGLIRHNVLLLQGMGGTGKTTLLKYLREWWQTTQFVREVFYFGYDERAWTLDQILFDLGERLFPDPYELALFRADPVEVQGERVIERLRGEAYGLVLDNLESVTGVALAIQHTLDLEQRERLREFLARLVGGRSKVVLGSRSQEAWLRERTFGATQGPANVYVLPGLDQEARTQLAERILQRQVPGQVRQIQANQAFGKLMKVLAGYPLAMEVVLANLRRQHPEEVLAGLQLAEVDLDVGGEDRTNNILKCVEYSHSNVSEGAQRLLLCLAQFSGFINRSDLPRYADQLKQQDPFREYPFDQFDAAVQEAIHWGLLSPMDEDGRLLEIQPVFPYFLKTKLQQEDPATREALQVGFKDHYRGLANSYFQWMESKDPQERQMGILFSRWEYENLYSALQICLERHESISIFVCLDKYFERIQDIPSALKLAEKVVQALDTYPPGSFTEGIRYEQTVATDLLASCYLETQQYQKAEQTYQKEIELLSSLDFLEERRKQLNVATAYHQLGSVAQEQRQWEQAQRYYEQALALKVEFNDRYEQARTYHNLGIVAQKQRQWEQAQRYYEQALALNVEFNDRYSQASTYHHLGIVAQEQRQWEQAQRYYEQALALKVEFNDRYSRARTYHQLGIVAQEQRQWEQAQRYYEQALALNVEFNDRYEQAGTYHQLGIVAQEQRQWEQAQRYYEQALALFVEFNDRYEQAGTYGQLGLLANAQGHRQQAIAYLMQALQIFAEFQDRYLTLITLRNLIQIAQETEDENLLQTLASSLNLSVADLNALIQPLGSDAEASGS